VDSVVGEDETIIVGLLQHAGIEQGMHVAVHGLHIAIEPSNYMSGYFQDEIECLWIEASLSFVREPQGNGVAERFIRTLKEKPSRRTCYG